MVGADYYSKEEDKIRCLLCPHNCLIPNNKFGICKVRHNHNGELVTDVYGKIAALHSDPIEKKPLYHFYPGSKILSIGTIGCNFHCSFCQNYQISQCKPSDFQGAYNLTPYELAERAHSIPENLGIAYTYNEPTVFFEMVRDTALLAREKGLKNVIVSNGFINRDPLHELLEVIDAFNIDLKAFDDSFYKKYTGGHLEPVLKSLQMVHRAGRHLEITFLVIPSLNDSAETFIEMTRWIAEELSPDVPLHISRYFPAWKSKLPPTSTQLISKFAEIASQYLKYVFIGNIGENNYSSTFCPHCRNVLIERSGYNTQILGITDDSRCKVCAKSINLPFVIPQK